MSNRKKLPPIIRLKYHKGDLVIKEGDYGITIYKIIRGEVRIIKEIEEGEVVLAVLGVGDIVGEMTFLKGPSESRSASVSRHTRYASLIGTYKSQEKLNSKRLAISELGYCPYIIHGANGESRLYTAAFYQKSLAEKHSADLASNGIQSQVVER